MIRTYINFATTFSNKFFITQKPPSKFYFALRLPYMYFYALPLLVKKGFIICNNTALDYDPELDPVPNVRIWPDQLHLTKSLIFSRKSLKGQSHKKNFSLGVTKNSYRFLNCSDQPFNSCGFSKLKFRYKNPLIPRCAFMHG
jgi:hypothetical protein